MPAADWKQWAADSLTRFSTLNIVTAELADWGSSIPELMKMPLPARKAN
jgi:hypothetical protein